MWVRVRVGRGACAAAVKAVVKVKVRDRVVG